MMATTPTDAPATMLADRAVIRLAGEDVRGFLQGLVTNDVAGALPVWAGLLSAQGKVLFDFLVWADDDPPPIGAGDALLVDCEATQAEALARRLALYRLRRPITIARDESLAVHWSRYGGKGVPDPRLAALGRRWIGPPAMPVEGWRAHRLSLGVTEGSAELGSDKTLWLEANAAELNGVSFAKGCYVGQENTARMNWRQKVNRRLVVERADAEPGDAARIWYPDLALAVFQRRVEALDMAMLPAWLKTAMTAAPQA